MSPARKISVQSIGRSLISAAGLLCGRKPAKVVFLPAREDLRAKLANPLVKKYALETSLIVLLHSRIMLILGGRGFAQVAPFVVRRIAIDMINPCLRPFPGHEHPNDSMEAVALVSEGNREAILATVKMAGWLPRSRPFGVLLPIKDAAIWVVGKIFPNEIGGDIVDHFRKISSVGGRG